MLADDALALRTGCARSSGEHLACVRIGGGAAHELLDRVSPRQLFVRSGQMLHTLLLDDAGAPVADVYLCCDDDCYFALAEGLAGAALVAYLRAHAGGLDVALDDLTASHAVVSLDGPYAWEVLAELTTPDVIGLPYLGFFHAPRFTCFRGGKTGEYGYDLMIPRDELAAVTAQLDALAARFAIRTIDRAAHDAAMLEAGFFRIRHAACAGLTPVELQLQWRIASGRSFPGAAAIAERRRAPHGRAVYVAAPSALAIGTAVMLDGAAVGRIIDAGPAPTRGEHLGVALLELAVAHAGLGLANGVRTISAPAVNNRSLYVDPQRHSWATRGAVAMPPLVRPEWS